MNSRYVSGAGIVAAVTLAGLASLVVGTPTLLGVTPLGAAIYILVGIALPQAVLARESGSRLQTAVAALAFAGGAAALGVGLAQNSLTVQQDLPLAGILLAGIVLALGIGAARAFYQGFQTAGE